ncbi:Glycine/D-amino acid oxidase [Parasphingorhabdus marina DSM 22363]|uniref:Glycine/D-amino acid oxidase n=1 Tax=Parasphingorhabdus marina DSM 22363 TaxID=1123272 RepID=A0A1N6GWV5_9SPHN|nr:FAD-dependent oxidoreductase [Parasphingorhabdus marina]SIO11835.1 Glycine/D-amino acid oxidase [Parasphingorhabdus marina DSM 22363]
MTDFDVIIIGAGIAGASIASEIGGERSVLVLEAEDHPGYHSTGRSAAFWTESYGGPQVQPLTTASFDFLKTPPADFSDSGFLTNRGAINIARTGQEGLVEGFLAEFADSGVAMVRWDQDEIRKRAPHIGDDWGHAIFEPDCCDIDVAGLHGAYLRDARRKGVVVECRARVHAIAHNSDGWKVAFRGSTVSAPTIVNAAGAWADGIAEMAQVQPLGIQPMRRTMVQLRTDPPSRADDPLVVALDGSFYFKPETGGSYWLSPHDEIPDRPGDVAPEELDVALAIDRFQSAVDAEIKQVTRKWAGLRSFAPDRLPVYGFDPERPDFFWFAGQGGFGIQTAPAAARLARALLLDEPVAEDDADIPRALYDPARFA